MRRAGFEPKDSSETKSLFLATLTFLGTAWTRSLRPASYHKIVIYTTLVWFMRA